MGNLNTRIKEFNSFKEEYNLESTHEGAFKLVCFAARKSDGHKVAIKKISVSPYGQYLISRQGYKTEEEWIEKECNVGALSNCNYVSRIVNLKKINGNYFMIEDRFEKTLKDRINEGMNSKETIKTTLQIIDGLKEAKINGVYHKDLKAVNVGIDGKGDVKLTDFGGVDLMSTEIHVDDICSTEVVPPELLDKTEGSVLKIDEKCNVYSVGCLIYQMLTKSTVYNKNEIGEEIVKKNNSKQYIREEFEDFLRSEFKKEDKQRLEYRLKKVPYSFRKILQKCLSANRWNRYNNLEELQDDLQKIGKSDYFISGVKNAFEQISSISPFKLKAVGNFFEHVVFPVTGVALASIVFASMMTYYGKGNVAKGIVDTWHQFKNTKVYSLLHKKVDAAVSEEEFKQISMNAENHFLAEEFDESRVCYKNLIGLTDTLINAYPKDIQYRRINLESISNLKNIDKDTTLEERLRQNCISYINMEIDSNNADHDEQCRMDFRLLHRADIFFEKGFQKKARRLFERVKKNDEMREEAERSKFKAFTYFFRKPVSEEINEEGPYYPFYKGKNYLNLAKMDSVQKHVDIAAGLFRQVVKDYPNTFAASKADSLIKDCDAYSLVLKKKHDDYILALKEKHDNELQNIVNKLDKIEDLDSLRDYIKKIENMHDRRIVAGKVHLLDRMMNSKNR